jgi:predicted phosphodiesterase
MALQAENKTGISISHGPWLTNPDVGGITIGFATASPCAAAIEYRLDGQPQWRKIHQSEGGLLVRSETRHIFHINGLVPGGRYEYKATAFSLDSDETDVRTGAFTAFDSSRRDYSFLVMADFQFPIEKRKALLRKYFELASARECDFVVCLGDMLDGIGDFETDVLRGVIDLLDEAGYLAKPVVFIRGNHELRGKAAWEWERWFASPQGNCYSLFRQGNAAFLALDSWADEPADSAPAFRLNQDEKFLADEKAFLRNAVEDSDFQSADFKILMAHGASHSHIDQFRFLNPNMRNLTDEFFGGLNPQIPLHAWICGHIHHYIRTVPGKPECASISPPPQPVVTPDNYTYPVLTTDGPVVMAHIVPPSGIQTSVFLVNVHENELDIKAISEERGLIDHFAISKGREITEKMEIAYYQWNTAL